MNLVIDIGNSRVKTGIFRNGALEEILIHDHQEFNQSLLQWIISENVAADIQYIGCATVGNRDILTELERLAATLPSARWLAIDYRTPLPVKNAYRSPQTLGMDRICACIGARSLTPKGAILVIDSGTAITYDYLDPNNQYLGGGIAPGLRSRFRSLNDYTASLPLVNLEGDLPLIGYDTDTSIRSGVVNGMVAEISGIVSRYRALPNDQLIVYLTGGDAAYLGNHLKNINFVNSDLLILGIQSVVSYYFANA